MSYGPQYEMDEMIAYIHRHLDEPLTLERLAKYAAYSPFHFTRLFKERIGLPPLYYISSLRLQKAKQLLLQTQLSVRDIALEIGQQSLGTFTTRFTDRVGMSPADFRNSQSFARHPLQALQQLTDLPREWQQHSRIAAAGVAVEGTLDATEPFEGIVLIGLFAKPIPEGMPLYGTLVSSLGYFCFPDVKPGTYFVMATSLAWNTNALDVLLPQTTLRTRFHPPLAVGLHSPQHVRVTLYPPRLDDPPILISLPVLMNLFLRRNVHSRVR